MTRFEKFYEWLCDAVCPIMIICLAVAACVFIKVFAGFAGNNLDAITLTASLGVSLIAFIVWVVCSVIKAHMLKSDEGNQA